MKFPRSSIPKGVAEYTTQAYEEVPVRLGKIVGVQVHYRHTECVLDGKIVGVRWYGRDNVLLGERPLKNGQLHGRVVEWYENGNLNSIEPYLEGKPHGVAKQYSYDGKLIGTYRMVHGTGLDVWRGGDEDGNIYITEIHPMVDGELHGYQWWFKHDQILNEENPYRKGLLHGIQRHWNLQDRLRRGYPKYWINGEQVTKRQYLRAARTDKTLPPFDPADNQPTRRFPAKIRRLLNAIPK
ncbi:MAG: hypothetical protein KF726_12450 [Anaerolineae bacterium]|nr:hypothetical protein [Anaerolineae bacterium]